jgi:Zn-dependent peptidase ImmA (M78 family)
VLHAQNPTVYVDDMPVHFRGEGYHPAPSTEEVEANAFAAELLMPEALLREDLRLGSIDALDEVAVRRLGRKYGVSAQAVTIRLAELGLVSGFGR